jgi:flagellar hook-length control protein FliK
MSASALLVASKPVQTVRPVVKNEGQGQGLPQASQGFAELLGEVKELAGLAAPLLPSQAVTTPLPGRGGVSAEIIRETGNLPLGLAERQVQALGALASGETGQGPRGGSPRRAAGEALAGGLDQHQGLRREAVSAQPYAVRSAEQQPAPPPAALPTEEELQGEVRTKPVPASSESADPSAAGRTGAPETQGRPDPSSAVVRQVATNLQFITRGDVERLRFSLHPEELGRVEIQLQKSGSVTRVTIVTETAQAFDALARNAGGLQQNLSQAGFETDDLRFSHREEEQPNEGRRGAYEERRDRHPQHRSDRDQDERREVLVRPAVSAADRQIFL